MTPQSRHIAFISPRFAEGPTVGGAETLLKNLAIHAVFSGYKVTFLTTCARNHFTWDNELPPGSRNVQGIEVHFFPVDTDRDIPAFQRAQISISTGRFTPEEEITWLKHNVNSRALMDHLRQHGMEYDRIVTGPYLFGLIYFASMLSPEKTIMVPCLHDEAFARLAAFGGMFNKVRGFMFNSEQERDLAVRLYGMKPQVSAVVGMGMDDFKSDGNSFRKRHKLSAPYLMFSGRREPLKGTPLLLDYLEAFRDRTGRDVKLVLTGTGQCDISSKLAGSVIDLGFVEEKEKYDAMAGATAFCHPSVNESFGIVLLESWLAGTPALVHAKSQVLKGHCLKSNGGMWFQSYPEFEEQLLLLLNNNALRTAMGNSGRDYVLEHYSWKSIQQKMIDALER